MLIRSLFTVLAAYSGSTVASNAIPFDAKICNDCGYSEAKQIASQIKPEIKCFAGDNADRMNPWDMQCYSSTRKVVVMNGATREIWGFYSGHTNQGVPDIQMSPFTVDISKLPPQVNIMMNQVADKYIALARITESETERLRLTNSSTAYPLNLGTFSASSTTSSCDNSPEAKAIATAFSGRKQAELQRSLQQKIDHDPDIKKNFSVREITSASFGASLDGIQLGGSWKFNPIDLTVEKHFFLEDYVPSSNDNIAAYAVKLKDYATVTVSPSWDRTVVDGFPLNVLKNTTANSEISAKEISACMAETIDKKWPKTVTGGTTGSPGSGSSISPSYNNIPLKKVGGRTGGQVGNDQCKHTYHNRSGEPIFEFLGPCP